MIIDFLTESAFGEVVSDTLVSAAIGAVATGAAYAVSGGSFSEGAKVGAIGGAVVGGTMSAWDQWGPNSSASPAAPSAPGSPSTSGPQPQVIEHTGASTNNVNTQTGDGRGGLLGWWDDVDANNRAEMLGSAIKGGAGGWAAHRQAEAQKKAAKTAAAADRERHMVNPDSTSFFEAKNIVPRIGRA